MNLCLQLQETDFRIETNVCKTILKLTEGNKDVLDGERQQTAQLCAKLTDFSEQTKIINLLYGIRVLYKSIYRVQSLTEVIYLFELTTIWKCNDTVWL